MTETKPTLGETAWNAYFDGLPSGRGATIPSFEAQHLPVRRQFELIEAMVKAPLEAEIRALKGALKPPVSNSAPGLPPGILQAYRDAYADGYEPARHLDAHTRGLRAVLALAELLADPSNLPPYDERPRTEICPGYHAQAGETKHHLHDVYTTRGELYGYERIYVGSLMRSAVEDLAAGFRSYVEANAPPQDVMIIGCTTTDMHIDHDGNETFSRSEFRHLSDEGHREFGRASADALMAAIDQPRPVDAERVEPNPAIDASEGTPLTVDYINYRGERGTRHILPGRIVYGATEYHPRHQWLLEAFDLDKGAMRVFAMEDMQFLKPPAHSPDKAVTREGVDVRLTSANGKHWRLEGPGWTMQPIGQVSADEAKELCERALAGLATKPTGTEAGRGVIPAGWKLVPEEPTEEMWAAFRNADDTGATFHRGYRAMLAATPTPPVSPSPDSAGPAEAREALARHLAQEHVANTDAEDGYDWADTDDVWKRSFLAKADRALAALTPSAPIADPSPDSTGPAGVFANSEAEVVVSEWLNFVSAHHPLELDEVQRNSLRGLIAEAIIDALNPCAPVADAGRDDGAREEGKEKSQAPQKDA